MQRGMLYYAATIQQRIFRYDIHDVSMTTALSKYSYILQFHTIITSTGTKVECTASDFNFISLFVRTERRSYSSYFHLLVSVNERLFFAV